MHRPHSTLIAHIRALGSVFLFYVIFNSKFGILGLLLLIAMDDYLFKPLLVKIQSIKVNMKILNYKKVDYFKDV